MPAGQEPDITWMREALSLAERGRFTTRPNPMVGAVVVSDGEVVGRGFHPRAGDGHAEVFALREAQERAQGATIYVTLEPCCHHGRTPPCTEAVIAAGIGRVVVGTLDPNPQVAGKGVAALEAAGISVTINVLQEDAHRLIRPFGTWITQDRPWVTLKSAITLDGRIATRTGASQWITGPEARHQGHILRASSDAIMVGSGTALADDPRLGVRGVSPLFNGSPDIQDPRRVIIDSQCRLPSHAQCLNRGTGPQTIVATACDTNHEGVKRLQNAGALVWSHPANDGSVDLASLLQRLAKACTPPVTTLLVEGGSTLAASFLKADWVDEIVLFVAPKLIGGDGLPMLGSLGIDHPDESPRWSIESTTPCGDDLMVKVMRERA